jgi:hypothetical protein
MQLVSHDDKSYLESRILSVLDRNHTMITIYVISHLKNFAKKIPYTYK